MSEHEVRVRRAYDEPEPEDGIRVLVDRVWPRGLTKVRAAFDEWCKTVAPSPTLRNWYGHDPERFEEFARRYRAELDGREQAEGFRHLEELATGQNLTLLTGTRRPDISQAAVLAALIRDHRLSPSGAVTDLDPKETSRRITNLVFDDARPR